MVEISFDKLIEKRVEEGKIPHSPLSPKQRVEFMRKYFKKSEVIQEVVPIYVFFKRIPGLDKTRSGEFRKNVNLKIIDGDNVTDINMDMLKEYAEVLERFISEVKHLLSK